MIVYKYICIIQYIYVISPHDTLAKKKWKTEKTATTQKSPRCQDEFHPCTISISHDLREDGVEAAPHFM